MTSSRNKVPVTQVIGTIRSTRNSSYGYLKPDMDNIRKSSKRILYRLGKRNFQKLDELGSGLGRGSKGVRLDLKTLRRLIQKGLVAKSEFDGYHLTPEGKKVAEKIVKEIDEYKRW